MTEPATPGFRLLPQYLSTQAQADLLGEVQSRIALAPLYTPITPGGKAMSVAMTNFGPLGWVTDAAGYRYQSTHPLTAHPWPDIPQSLLDLWSALCTPDAAPDACLVNLYGPAAKMGLHQDKDESDFAFPVLSVSLGDHALFRLGGARRTDPTASFRLSSGDVCILQGPGRLAYHGIDRIIPGSSRLIPGGGRINLTLRRAA